jgi:sulfatase-like protein
MLMSVRALPILSFALLAAGCEPKPASAPTSAVRASQILITIEAVAPRHLTPFGGTVAMPNLAAVAAAGTIYDDAITTTPLARPALATILTGVSPDRSGVRDNIHDALPASVPTIAEAAAKAGFETAAFVSTPFASYASGLQRGFDLFDGPETVVVGPAQHVPPVVGAKDVADHFKQWLGSRKPEKPVFAWIHLADLNGLAAPPPGSAGFSVAKTGDPLEDYDKRLAEIDEAIGAIASALKNDPTAGSCGLLIVGTHGAYLGEGGRRGEAFWLADETLRVPLVRVARLSDPAAGGPKHEPRPTWLPDVAASLARAVGAALPDARDGSPLEEAPPAARPRLAWDYALDDQLAWPPLTAVKEGMVLSVFEASGDGGLRPLGEVSASATAAAGARPALPRRRVLPEANRSAVERERLKLGHPTTPAAHPAKVDDWLRDLQVVRRFLQMQRAQLSGRSSRKLLKEAPESFAALLTRLFVISSVWSDELKDVRDKLLALYPERSEALHWAAHVALVGYDPPAAAALLDAAIAVGPVEPEMYYDRACVHARLGEAKPALSELETAITAGYRNWDWIDKDPDLAAIRSDPGFAQLLKAHGR